MRDEWIEALGGVETYRSRYRRFNHGMSAVVGFVGALIGASVHGQLIARSSFPWLVGILATFVAMTALFRWFVPDPDDLFDEGG